MLLSLSALAWAAPAGLRAQVDVPPAAPRQRLPDHNADDFHRQNVHPSPRAIMTWLRASMRAATTTEAATAAAGSTPEASRPAPPPRSASARPARPAGAGRWVAAVVVDAELDIDPHVVLGVRREDLLVLSSPGPSLRPEELAVLERAVRTEHLALCVVMVRDGKTTASADADTAAARALRRRLQDGRDGAAAAGMTEAAWHAVLQADLVTSASEELRSAAKQSLLRASVLVLPARGAPTAESVRWRAAWFDRPLANEIVAEPATPALEPTPPPAPGKRH